jgi:L-ascorbate metabolism protein UlaG (beta-lactamase superfamily)
MIRLLLLVILWSPMAAAQMTTVRYLANEGVMVSQGDTKALFDPLFNNGFGQYQMVPDAVRAAIFAGEPPFDGIDAVFISHYHGDHFSAEDILRLLRSQDGFRLYAPAQAVAALRDIAGPDDGALFDRITGLDIDYGDDPVSIDAGDLVIGAAHVPHAGWPTRRPEVQNLAFRVTFGDSGTVLHLGDADSRLVHFESHDYYWEDRTIDVALPPFWFFGSDDGVEILENRLDVIDAIGIHVPDRFADPGQRPEELFIRDLFTQPGETRQF